MAMRLGYAKLHQLTIDPAYWLVVEPERVPIARASNERVFAESNDDPRPRVHGAVEQLHSDGDGPIAVGLGEKEMMDASKKPARSRDP